MSASRSKQARQIDLFKMFDPGHSLDERILAEQFDSEAKRTPDLTAAKHFAKAV